MYDIDSEGNIYSHYVKRYVRPQNNGKGYMKYCFKDLAGNINQRYIHREVALAFVPGYEEGLCVDHIDRNKSNNSHINLRWVTLSENQEFKDKRYKYNPRGTTRSYKKETRMKARSLFIQGLSTVEISKVMDIPRQTIRNWVKPC